MILKATKRVEAASSDHDTTHSFDDWYAGKRVKILVTLKSNIHQHINTFRQN